jgi:hypothetical protein
VIHTMSIAAASCLPVPYFQIDGSLRILNRSAIADSQFPAAVFLHDIVDEESLTKLTQLVKPLQDTRVEINLLSTDNLPALYELYQCWEDKETGHVVAIRQQSRIHALQQSMEQLREGLQKEAPSPNKVTQLSPVAGRKQAKLHIDAASALETIDDLMIILRADFIELGRTPYSDIITEKVNELRDLLRQLKEMK